MESPFPGMDPFAEGLWSSVHTQLIALAVMSLNTELPPDLAASPEERVEVLSEETEGRAFYPDIKVIGPDSTGEGRAASASAVAVGQGPVTYRLSARFEPRTERYIRIVEADSDRLITVVEFISPANKSGAGLTDFIGKRAALLEAGVNVVEIDLTRAGRWMALLHPHFCPPAYRTDYRVVVRRAEEPAAVFITPIAIRSSLPTIRIPLRSEAETVPLDLQSLFEQTYRVLKLGRRLNYAIEPDPPLDPADAVWAEELLRAAGLRTKD